MLKLIFVVVLVLAGITAYKLWKSGKAVTGASVVDGVKSEVQNVVTKVEDSVQKK